MGDWILVLLFVAFAVIRFTIHPSGHIPTWPGSFEAFAHIYVGFLFGKWHALRHFPGSGIWVGAKEVGNAGTLYLVLAVGISLIELIAFLIGKFA